MAAQQKENNRTEAVWAKIGAELKMPTTPEERALIIDRWTVASEAHCAGVAVKQRMAERHI
eukprot:12372406-Heterocapsa_arctica.AAC.1